MEPIRRRRTRRDRRELDSPPQALLPFDSMNRSATPRREIGCNCSGRELYSNCIILGKLYSWYANKHELPISTNDLAQRRRRRNAASLVDRGLMDSIILKILLDIDVCGVTIKPSSRPLLCSGPAVRPACRKFSGVFSSTCRLNHSVYAAIDSAQCSR